MSTTLIARPLVKADFAPYGSVVEPYGKDDETPENCYHINNGYACRHDAMTPLLKLS
ncbi:ureidoglycolate lyase [Psychrobacter frigidicola]|uniref:ureidoglycolate lyase n=1 Tax=Psychrobacter frigidicola TaxID=45611 RepID=UPI002234CC89|nr:ureidoglycolate lyase [Psychrobacter frigidicola]